MTRNDKPAESEIIFRKVQLANEKLLEAFYRLYSSVFTLPEEREPIEGFRLVLGLNLDAAVQSDFGPLSEEILVAVDRSSNAVVGAANYIIYEYRDGISDIAASCQLNFLCVDKPWRNKGIAGRLLDEMERELRNTAQKIDSSGRAFLTCEQNNPGKMTDAQIAADRKASQIDPYDRLRWWQRHKFRKLLFPYSQPPLNPGQAPCEYLDYYIRFAGSRAPSAIPGAMLEEHLRRFLFVSVGKMAVDMAKNPQWKQMKEFCSVHENIEIAGSSDLK